MIGRVDDNAGVRVQLEDGDDRLDAATLQDQNPPPTAPGTTFFAFEANGGDGVDSLIGADATFSCVNGGRGDDQIRSGLSDVVPRRATCALTGGEGNDALIGNGSDNVFAGGPGIDSVAGNAGRDSANGGAGNDAIKLGGGNDFANGGPGDDGVMAGPGRDILAGSDGLDLLLGESGDDRFRLDYRFVSDTDEIRGGEGEDTARFLCESCEVSLNARADDGERGREGLDNALQIENVTTSSSRFDVTVDVLVDFGPGDGVITGNRFANVLEGNRGPDLISGAGGSDILSGGPGGDRIRAADGERDLVSCGRGRDLALADRIDRLRGCERVRV